MDYSRIHVARFKSRQYLVELFAKGGRCAGFDQQRSPTIFSRSVVLHVFRAAGKKPLAVSGGVNSDHVVGVVGHVW